MEEKKMKISKPVIWAKQCFTFVLIYFGIIMLAVLFSVLEKHIGDDHFIFKVFSPFLSLLAFVFVVAPLVLFLFGLMSFIGLLKTKETSKKPYFHALTSFLFGIVIIGIFIGSIVNKYLDARSLAKEIICRSHEHALASRCFSYQVSYDRWPAKDSWCDITKSDNDLQRDAFRCSIDNIGPCSYAMNENIPMDAKEFPDDLVLLFESAPGWNQIGGADDVVTDRHDKPGANIAFADGHVEFVDADKISALHWTIEE